MSEETYTPGPWKPEILTDGTQVIAMEDEVGWHCICRFGYHFNVNKHDVALISKAPDMHEAIKETIAYPMCGECDQDCIHFYETTPAILNCKPCPEVEKLLKLTAAEWLKSEYKRLEEKAAGN